MQNDHPEVKFGKTGVLLINLGTPDSTSWWDIRKYLKEFLSDRRVIELNPIIWQTILNIFILNLRPSKTAEAYKEIWTKAGSPLITTSKAQQSLLQSRVDFPVTLAMRYGEPSIEKTVQSLVAQYPLLKSIHVIPLYPHYAMASTKTVEVLTKKIINRAKHTIKVSFQPPFYDDTNYLDAVASMMKPEMGKSDHLIFSYHGIPIRHLRKTDPTGRHCGSKNCCKHPSKAWETCYKYQTIVTTRKLAALLQLSEGDYTISYQSRLGNDPWILPKCADFLERTKDQFPLTSLVSHRFKLEDINEAFEKSDWLGENADKTITRAMIEP